MKSTESSVNAIECLKNFLKKLCIMVKPSMTYFSAVFDHHRIKAMFAAISSIAAISNLVVVSNITVTMVQLLFDSYLIKSVIMSY